MTPTNHKVLLIEDNPLNMELATDLLESNGMVVCQARTAEDGLQQALDLPDIILMDLSLPGMDGVVAMRMLRATSAIKHLPVIALTARAMKGDEANAICAGFDGYLAKPIDTRTFVKSVMSFIEAANMRQPLLTDTSNGLFRASNLRNQADA
jgi:CheY-like chemotaxis protein